MTNLNDESDLNVKTRNVPSKSQQRASTNHDISHLHDFAMYLNISITSPRGPSGFKDHRLQHFIKLLARCIDYSVFSNFAEDLARERSADSPTSRRAFKSPAPRAGQLEDVADKIVALVACLHRTYALARASNRRR